MRSRTAAKNTTEPAKIASMRDPMMWVLFFVAVVAIAVVLATHWAVP